MAKYQCQANCGNVVESDTDKAPECCGKAMKKVEGKDDSGGCCGCC